MESASPGKWEDLDSDEIASIASEDLRENRPNRWQGPKSTWRALTEEERLLWQSMRRSDDQDLGVHLFNAHALKRRARDPATAQDLVVQTENGQSAVWSPPKLWTAWPLAEGRLPQHDFTARPGQGDEDEEFTFCRKEAKMPSTDLQEEIGAAMLRTAKSRFLRRKRKWAAVRHSQEDQGESSGEGQGKEQYLASEMDESTSSAPAPRSASAIPANVEVIEMMELDKSQAEQETRSRSTSRHGSRVRSERRRTHEPVVSADDEQSLRLLGPSIRHIISQLDSTLQILHNTRTTGPGSESDSSTEESESDSSTEQRESNGQPASSSPQKRNRGAPRKGSDSAAGDSRQPSTSRRGRPRKPRVQLEGESHEDMAMRVARESHRPLPRQSQSGQKSKAEEESSGEQDAKSEQQSQADQDALFEEWLRAGTRRGSKLLGLRDWSDVIGAASLVGFPAPVIARTARRCADLFGEGMTLRHLHELPANHGAGIQTTEYRPEALTLSNSGASPASSTDEGSQLLHRRIASRQASSPLRSADSPSPSVLSQRSRSQTRSRSRSASAGQQHYCPVASCVRAATGFSRRANLRRHMALVHGDISPEEVGSSPSPGGLIRMGSGDVDSEDDVVGAVHVDGFLRVVVPSRGWRGEDLMTRKRKRPWGEKRVRGREGERSEMASDDEGEFD